MEIILIQVTVVQNVVLWMLCFCMLAIFIDPSSFQACSSSINLKTCTAIVKCFLSFVVLIFDFLDTGTF